MLVVSINFYYMPFLMDFENDIALIEARLGYNFKDKALLMQALTHRSFLSEVGAGIKDNENLEFLGDAVLELIVSDMLFKRFSENYREGDLTKMRAYLVSEPRLVELAKALELGSVLRLSHGEEKSGGRQRPSILADAFEAVTGAIYLDGGFVAAFSFLKEQFTPLIELAPDRGLMVDYKSRLQELTQKQYHFAPTYRLLEVSGPDHRRFFRVGLFFNEKEISQGSGKTKKEAEQQAAKAALENLEGISS